MKPDDLNFYNKDNTRVLPNDTSPPLALMVDTNDNYLVLSDESSPTSASMLSSCNSNSPHHSNSSEHESSFSEGHKQHREDSIFLVDFENGESSDFEVVCSDQQVPVVGLLPHLTSHSSKINMWSLRQDNNERIGHIEPEVLIFDASSPCFTETTDFLSSDKLLDIRNFINDEDELELVSGCVEASNEQVPLNYESVTAVSVVTAASRLRDTDESREDDAETDLAVAERPNFTNHHRALPSSSSLQKKISRSRTNKQTSTTTMKRILLQNEGSVDAMIVQINDLKTMNNLTQDQSDVEEKKLISMRKQRILKNIRVNQLPQTFSCKYLGKACCTSCWGQKGLRAPIDTLVERARRLSSLNILMSVDMSVTEGGMHMQTSGNEYYGALPIGRVSFAAQDNLFDKVFACILTNSYEREHAAVCYAFLCVNSEAARRAALSMTLAFRAFAKRIQMQEHRARMTIELHSDDLEGDSFA